MADYDWDFNAPGYGALLPTDDVQALLSRVVNRPEPEPESEAPTTAEAEQKIATDAIDGAEPTKNFVAPPAQPMRDSRAADAEIAAPQQGHETQDSHTISTNSTLRRPRHGGALPL
jgi:hypothetical protein